MAKPVIILILFATMQSHHAMRSEVFLIGHAKESPVKPIPEWCPKQMTKCV